MHVMAERDNLQTRADRLEAEAMENAAEMFGALAALAQAMSGGTANGRKDAKSAGKINGQRQAPSANNDLTSETAELLPPSGI